MPTIKKPNQHFDATLYTGNGGTQSITNAGGFQPDFVWLKERSSTSSHNVYDSIRGTTKYLLTSTTDAEGTDAASLTAFNSNGFSLGGAGYTNENAQTYVGWQWKAGGASTVNTSGSISSNVSVNTTAGFSIVTYAGTLTSAGVATVGHGLGVAPKMIISKSLGTSQWVVQHTSLTSPSYFLYLNTTDAQDNKAGNGTMSAPTSTVFSTNWTTGLNVSGSNHVAYCWAEVEGYSKFGSYTGNGSTNGPFIFLGFRPKFVMIKCSSAGGVGLSWSIYDTLRSPYNVSENVVYADSTAAEGTGSAAYIDILSNGFKIKNVSGTENTNGATYIYIAFAESPFKFTTAR